MWDGSRPEAILRDLRDPRRRRGTLRLLLAHHAHRPPEEDPDFWRPIMAELRSLLAAEAPRRRDLIAGATLAAILRGRCLELLFQAPEEGPDGPAHGSAQNP